jgi:hypothetical protein
MVLSGCTGFQVQYDRTTLTPGAKQAATAAAADVPTSAPPPTASAASVQLPANLVEPDLLPYKWEDLTPFKDSLQPEFYDRLGQSIRQPHYQINLTIGDDLTSISGSEELLFTNQTGGSLPDVVLRMFPAIMGSSPVVKNIQVNGVDARAAVSGQGSVYRIPLPTPLQDGGAVTISLDFNYEMPADPSGNYAIFAYANDILALAHFYPVLSEYGPDGWRTEIPPQQGDILFNEASLYLVRVTAPVDVMLISSGSSLRTSQVNNRQVEIFAAGPARDFYLAASPALTGIDRSTNGVTLRVYYPSGEDAGGKLALDTMAKALADYDKLVGPYPYTELEVVATPTQALGVEYPGAIAINRNLFDIQGSDPNSDARIYLESTVAHEIGHQWFYNVVGDDQLRQPWLDESLTQYITYRYYQQQYGDAGGQGMLSSFYSRWDRVERAKIPIGLPVDAYADDEYSPIVYGRGPLFFRELEQKMGVTKFDAFLKSYYAAYQWKVATTADIQASLQSACACDLTKEFNDWVNPK